MIQQKKRNKENFQIPKDSKSKIMKWHSGGSSLNNGWLLSLLLGHKERQQSQVVLFLSILSSSNTSSFISLSDLSS